MSKEMKKLAEEVKDRFCKFLCGGYNYGENRCDCYPRETWGTAQAQCSRLNDTVDFAIARIGKAIISGEDEELDKALGILGRFQQRRGKSVFKEGTAMKLIWDGALLIAVRKEETEDLDKWIGEDIEAEIKRQFPQG